MTVIATAGHVDHGKSTLVRALTGTDPDRLAEEKERGLTIDLGFANLPLSRRRSISLIDVPGHIRFLRNMLAGVGAVQGVLFVVSATEGWKPQSEEHLRILDLLGLEHAVIAVTMADLVDTELLELAVLDVEDHIVGTFAEGAPIVPVSGVTGHGIDELKSALTGLFEAVGSARNRKAPRLWVDRSFSPTGTGTVVTGTLTDGELAVGDNITVVPTREEGRVRTLQSHHRSVDVIKPGNRVAINLSGIGHASVKRGDVLVHPDRWHSASIIDAEIRVLPQMPQPLTRRGAFQTYIGSGEFSTRVRLLGGVDQLNPGATGKVRLYLDRPVPALPGDRFVLRESGRSQTVGGGRFLDIDPVVPAKAADPDGEPDRVLQERGWIDARHFAQLTGEERQPNLGAWLVSSEALAAAESSIRERIASAGELGLDIALLDQRERALLDARDDIVVDGGRATIGQAVSEFSDHPWLAELDDDPFHPPAPDTVDRGEVRAMVRQGLVVETEGIFFSSAAVEQAAELIRVRLTEQDEGVTVADVRDMLDTTRKYVLALLAHFDQNGRTRRRGDYRIAGPRL
ncbi:MAG: selenocysteine-specific translation elongation factor [Acidimicrobiia bacterium]